jgi:hypothetical protein
VDGQGYNIEECILNQDNMSVRLLETNGNKSSSKPTKHIGVRYFRVSNGDITPKHCPMGEMLAGHFTKPLQRALFRKFRAEIQGIPVYTNEEKLSWDREEKNDKNERIEKADPSPQTCVGLKRNRDPRPRDSRLRRMFLLSLQSNIGQDGSNESALEAE